MTPRIIALCAKAGHGKSTAAAHLVATHGAHRIGFADRLKDLACRVYGLERAHVDTQEGKLSEVRFSRMGVRAGGAALVNPSEEWKTVRELLQMLGTEARGVLGEGVWVSACMTAIQRDARERVAAGEPAPTYVIDDLRFPNEAKAVRGYGGTVIRLVRPGAPVIADPTHPSEAGVDACEVDAEVYASDVPALVSGVDQVLAEVDRLRGF